MNKLAKRVLAFMLMVCMLTAMVPAVVSAEAADPYVIDFEIDKNANLTWQPFEDTIYSFAGTNFAHAQTNSGHAAWLSAFNNYYENGDINFSFPHAVITAEMAEADETLVDHIGKIADASTYKSHYLNSNQFGSYKYNATSTTYNWTGMKIGAASKTYNTSNVGWNAVVLRAPDAGTYDVTLEYSLFSAAGSNAKVFLLPYTAEMKAKVASNPAGWNADITALITEGADADSYVGTFSSWVASGSATVPGQIFDMGQISVGIEVDEYLMVISQTAGKYDYLQNVTFTPVAEQPIANEVIERNYSIAGTISSGSVKGTSAEMVTAMEEKYDAGDIDWSYLGTTANDSEIALDKSKLYTQNFYVNNTGDDNDLFAWEAFKLRSPGEGTYDISFNTATGSTSAQKTQIWTSVYMAEYTEGMDPASVITDANRIGYHRPEKSDATVANVIDEVGEYTFGTADKEYVIVLHYDGDYNGTFLQPNKDYSSADPAIDCYMTANTYMAAFVIEPQVAAPEYVTKAYIGTTAYSTVAAAAAAAQEGDTIKLAVDFTGNIDLPAGVSVDLNGHTWTVTEYVATNAMEYVTDSVGTGKLVNKNMELFANNMFALPLLNGDSYTYSLVDHSLSVAHDDYETVGDATRFWFKLSLTDAAAYDLIASGNTGLTIGVELDWGGEETLAVTFDNGEGAEAFAADWAAAAKNNENIWLYVDITGVENLENTLYVKPVLTVNGQTDLWTAQLIYPAA